jgi:2-dehydropantoate 2-reductase
LLNSSHDAARSTVLTRVLVAGAGALGSVFGGFLRLAGHDVTLLGRGAHLEAIRAQGLRIDGLWGDHHAAGFGLAASPADACGPFSAVLLTVKSYDTEAMAAAVAPLVAADGVVVSLQNGLGNAERIAAHVGSGRVLAARVIFGAELMAPGHVRVTVYADPVLVGLWDDAPGTRLDAQARSWAAHFAAAGIPATYSDDLRAALWGKVLYNAALNPLSALLGVQYGALGEHAHTRAVMDAVIDEAFAVACAEGVNLPWASGAAYRTVFYSRLVPATFHHRSSMLQDLDRGRPTEIDAINGQVWTRGAARGIATPVNEVLTRLVHAREAINRGGVS